MDLKIRINDEVYNHFLNNNYTRADVIAVHTALNNADVISDWIPLIDGAPQLIPYKHYLFTTVDGDVIERAWDGCYSKYLAYMEKPKGYEKEKQDG